MLIPEGVFSRRLSIESKSSQNIAYNLMRKALSRLLAPQSTFHLKCPGYGQKLFSIETFNHYFPHVAKSLVNKGRKIARKAPTVPIPGTFTSSHMLYAKNEFCNALLLIYFSPTWDEWSGLKLSIELAGC